MQSDLEIAQAAKLRPIEDVAKEAGIRRDELELYGDYKAKVKLEILDRLKGKPMGKFVDVTAITPTPLGEGKTVTTVGLGQGLKKIGKKAFTCIRQPSLGPVFGIKGGAAGGGFSQIIPMEDFNLHLTGDVHAISIAHNLGAAFLDNALKRDNKLNIDPRNILWRRVVDLNDRWALEKIVTGLGEGFVRETGFDVSVASEIMAILGLTSGLRDMRERIGRMVMAFTYDEKPITAEDLKVAGAMTVLMKDAIKPNLMQNLEGGPAFVHAGPFANIAHGNSSIIADQMALRLADYVVTESGFGADIGMEKFFDIKCRIGGLVPNCVVIVASIRALKMHSGKFRVVAGRPLDPGLLRENTKAVAEGCVNLAKHIQNAKYFGIPSVVVINKFTYDTPAEIEVVKQKALEAGAETVVEHSAWADGGEGAAELAEAVVAACEKPGKFQFLYPAEASIKEKIETIAKKMYGAAKVEFMPEANRKIKLFTSLGWSKLPICMAKTHLSISHDPELKGAPSGYTFPVRDIRASVGAGFLYPLCGDMRTIPGLPSTPAGEAVDIDEKGNVVGLF